MIWFVPHTDIDKVKWDLCISESEHGRIFAYSWFLDIMCPGWHGLIDGDYNEVFPLTQNSKFGYSYLYQPFFTQQLGLFSRSKPDRKKVTSFLKTIPAKYKFIDINLNSSNEVSPGQFEIFSNKTFEVDLSGEYELLYSNYTENAKRNIKKGGDQHVVVSIEENLDDLISMFRSNQGIQYSRIKSIHYSQLKSVMQEGIKQQVAETYIARTSNGLICAGAYFIHSNNRFIFLFSGNTPESRENGAVFLLIDQFIKDHSGSMDLLDFMGSNKESLARFYAGFGAKEVLYPRIRINRLPWYVKWMKS
jgi:hypothetical protein